MSNRPFSDNLGNFLLFTGCSCVLYFDRFKSKPNMKQFMKRVITLKENTFQITRHLEGLCAIYEHFQSFSMFSQVFTSVSALTGIHIRNVRPFTCTETF